MRFMARASEHGFSVSKPWGAGPTTSLSSSKGAFCGCKSNPRPGEEKIAISASYAGRNKPAYTSQQVDFVAVYIVPKNIWFIFPIDVVLSGRDLTLSPHLEVSKNGAYEEAWHLMLSGDNPMKISTVIPSAARDLL